MSTIYLKQGDGIVPMREAPYDAEDVLQALLADHPELIASDEGATAQRLVLVRRELGVADRPGGGSRWSLDHLFIDGAAVPTLVEVKRSTNPELRREVVGQMLDYAANGSSLWSVADLRTEFEATQTAADRDPTAVLEDLLRDEMDLETYWKRLETNLASGHIRLVFVADRIPHELRSIVEFLNEQMSPAEVLAIEVTQYLDADGSRATLVPRLLGRTQAAERRKHGPTARGWDKESVLEAVEAANDATVRARWSSCYDQLRALGARPYFGSGRTASVNLWLAVDTPYTVALTMAHNGISVNLDFVRKYRDDEGQARLKRLVRALPLVGERLEEYERQGFASRPLLSLADVIPDDAAVDAFVGAIAAAAAPAGQVPPTPATTN